MLQLMLSDICVLAPAKVNLGLKVLPKRVDGFHSIESIFQKVSLCDKLHVSLTAKKNTCIVNCSGMVLPENNTLSTSYKSFCSLFGCDFGVKVDLEKEIPSGGGLGGGSSDAASFLNALATLVGRKLSFEEADKLASDVGSDVFFFLHALCSGLGAAVVSGRGENVKSFEPRKDLHFVMVLPGVHSSTKEAYALLDNDCDGNVGIEYPALNKLEEVYRKPVKDWTFVNSFTRVIAEKYSEVSRAIEAVKAQGALFTDMSGSGSTVIGVFDSELEAKKAVSVLSKNWKVCVAV